MRFTLRDYQIDGVNKIRNAYARGFKAPLYTLPTGGGKTVLYAYITESAASKGNRVLVLEHRRELIRQASGKLSEINVSHGVIAPGFSMTGDSVQIASVQTLGRRLDKIPAPDMIIIDEAHHAAAGTWSKIIQAFPKAKLLGVTATPQRMDGKGLGTHCGSFFDTLITGPSVKWLIDNNYLCQPLVYAPPTDFNIDGIKTIAGDYDKKEVNNRIDKPKITGCAIDHYNRLCPDAPALVFCSSLKHAAHVLEQARENCISAEILDGKLSIPVREARIKALATGMIKWLITVDVVNEGTDIPIVSTAILLRPTKSLGLYLQQVGRVLRPYESKQNAIILDHVGNCHRHGLPDMTRVWSLDGYKPKRKRKNQEPELQIKQCKICYAVFSATLNKCPQCGHEIEANGREYEQVAGTLKLVNGTSAPGKTKRNLSSEESNRMRKIFAIANSMGFGKQMAYRVYHTMKKKNINQGMV